MKKLFAAALVLLFCTASHAQLDTRPFIFSMGPEASLPVGTLSKTNKLGLGGNLNAQFYLAEKLRLLASFGGVLYQGKEYTSDLLFTDKYSTIATLGLNGGLKYYLTDVLFAIGSIGVNEVNFGGERKIGLAYAPVLGVELGGMDLLLKYNVINVKSTNNGNLQAVGFCIGYRF